MRPYAAFELSGAARRRPDRDARPRRRARARTRQVGLLHHVLITLAYTLLQLYYGVRMGTAPIGSRVVLHYDLTPAEWGSGSVTMRFLVENYPKKVIPTFFEGSTMFDRYVSYKSYGRYKMRISKQGDTSGKVGSITS